MITFRHSGNFKKTENFLMGASRLNLTSILNTYGRRGVQALEDATPILTGMTAHSWDYKIEQTKGRIKITWFNDNVEGGIPVVILIQYGHGTRNGGYIPGKDFINPALKPILDELTEVITKEVSRL